MAEHQDENPIQKVLKRRSKLLLKKKKALREVHEVPAGSVQQSLQAKAHRKPRGRKVAALQQIATRAPARVASDPASLHAVVLHSLAVSKAAVGLAKIRKVAQVRAIAVSRIQAVQQQVAATAQAVARVQKAEAAQATIQVQTEAVSRMLAALVLTEVRAKTVEPVVQAIRVSKAVVVLLRPEGLQPQISARALLIMAAGSLRAEVL